MSGDISPPGGSWLDPRAMPGGERSEGAAVRPPQRGEPSLVRVVGTTLRLWWRRRVLRVPDGARIGALRWAVIAVVLAVLAGGGVTAALAGARSAPAAGKPAVQRPSPAQLQIQANEQAAGSWIQAQVTAGAAVGCDPAMCGYLRAAGVPAADEVLLARGASVPGSAAFVLSTPLLRAQSGPALATGAPEIAAAFGTGPQRVEVRIATPGAAAFLLAVQHARKVSARMGRSLVRDRLLRVGPVTRRELTSGMVDRRLLVVLKRMLTAHAVSVAGFADVDPGASWPAQLRLMLVDGLVHHVGTRRISYLGADLSLLHSLRPPYTVSVQEITRQRGGATLVIQVPLASSP